MIAIAIFTNWFSAAFNTILWPIIGFLLMPYTPGLHAAMRGIMTSVNGGWLVLVIVAVLVDLGGQGGSTRRRRRA